MGLLPDHVQELILGDDLAPAFHHDFENAEGAGR
jgi:hypothetical protein